MNKVLINSLLAIATLFAVSAAQAAVPGREIDRRQARQELRIAHGISSGQLNGGEAARLLVREAAIERREAAYRASGGGLSRAERNDLNRRLNRSSRAIRRKRHDG